MRKARFYYAVNVKYNEGYFDNPNKKLEVVLGFASVNEQTPSSIQKLMKHAVVESIEPITFQEFLNI